MALYVGSLVSVDCGNMGIFQGIIHSIQSSDQTITLRQPFLNGRPHGSPTLTIFAKDVRELSILKPPGEVAASLTTKENNKLAEPSEAPVIRPLSVAQTGFVKKKGAINGCIPISSEVKQQQQVKQQVPVASKGGTSSSGSGGSGSSPVNINNQLMRSNSKASKGKNGNGTQKSQNGKNGNGNGKRSGQDFDVDVSGMHREDFDFDAANALFDRASMKREFETLGFSTPEGVCVPTITVNQRGRLLDILDERGFELSRLVESFGQATLSFVSHQIPANRLAHSHIVVMAGDHQQGACALAAARHISNAGARVSLLSPPGGYNTRCAAFRAELDLFLLTEVDPILCLADIDGAVDMVICALDGEQTQAPCSEQERWFDDMVYWCNNEGPTNILALDPPTSGGSVPPKWTLTFLLPLALKPICGRIYLANVGVPSTVLSLLGPRVNAPFGGRQIVELERK